MFGVPASQYKITIKCNLFRLKNECSARLKTASLAYPIQSLRELPNKFISSLLLTLRLGYWKKKQKMI